MTAYIIRMLILLPLVTGMAVGALWLWRKYGGGMMVARRDRHVNVIDAVPMGTMGKLAVVEFGDKHLLIAVTRNQINLIAEAPRGTAMLPGRDGDDG